MKRSLVALLVAVPLILLLAFGLRRDPTATASTLVGKPAPPFALRTAEGHVVRLASYRNHVVVVNFWATWCPSCLVEHQNLVRVWKRYAPEGVEFVGITFRDSVAKATEFLRQHGGNWPVLADPNVQTAIDYGVLEPPETFIIDRHGVVRYKALGAVAPGGAISPTKFAHKLMDTLAASPAPNMDTL